MKRKFLLLSYFSFLIPYFSFSQSNADVYPTNWWVGMKWNRVQVMVHKKSIAENADVKLFYPGVQLSKVEKTENPNYLFLDLLISPNTKPGTLKIAIHNKNGAQVVDYVLKPRRNGNGHAYAQGVTSADLIYLIMPDRFSNGDVSNDRFTDMKEVLRLKG